MRKNILFCSPIHMEKNSIRTQAVPENHRMEIRIQAKMENKGNGAADKADNAAPVLAETPDNAVPALAGTMDTILPASTEMTYMILPAFQEIPSHILLTPARCGFRTHALGSRNGTFL
ncbi:MAG: hypothetical protein LBB67_02135 [Oscillospiraceae bacterium]|nr:hypothetical protein [Oscillospiraceae bacterium]